MTRGRLAYTQPPACGSAGPPGRRSGPRPRTGRTRAEFAHACQRPWIRRPLLTARRTPPRAAVAFPLACGEENGEPAPASSPAITTIPATRRSTRVAYHTTNEPGVPRHRFITRV